MLSANLNPLSSDHSGSQKYVDYMEHIHPNYIRELLGDAQNIKGGKASYEEFIVTMNQKSFIPSETRCTLSLHRQQLYRWFIDNAGKEMSPKEKPLYILDHKVKRKMWVKEWYTLLTDKFANVAMLDEKWFYTTNRRRKTKRLPLGGNEKEGDNKVKHPQMRSRRSPIKPIFALERVSKKHVIKKKLAHQYFSDDVNINSKIKVGRWKDLYIPGSDIQLDDLKELIGENYDLKDHIIDRLEFSYKQKVGNKGKSKICVINNHEELISNNHSHISNIMLKVRYQEVDIVERDCSSDSSYMLSAMIRVGKSICEKFHKVPMHEKLYVFIDGAGSHGTNEAINEFDENLMIYFNIKLVFKFLKHHIQMS